VGELFSKEKISKEKSEEKRVSGEAYDICSAKINK